MSLLFVKAYNYIITHDLAILHIHIENTGREVSAMLDYTFCFLHNILPINFEVVFDVLK